MILLTPLRIKQELSMMQDCLDDICIPIVPHPSDKTVYPVINKQDCLDEIDVLIKRLSFDYEFYNASSDDIKLVVAYSIWVSNVDYDHIVTMKEVMSVLRDIGFDAFLESLSDYYPSFLFSTKE